MCMIVHDATDLEIDTHQASSRVVLIYLGVKRRGEHDHEDKPDVCHRSAKSQDSVHRLPSHEGLEPYAFWLHEVKRFTLRTDGCVLVDDVHCQRHVGKDLI